MSPTTFSACRPRPLTRVVASPVLADGWGFSQLGSHPVGEGPGALKHQIIGTLHAATYMRGEREEEIGGGESRRCTVLVTAWPGPPCHACTPPAC